MQAAAVAVSELGVLSIVRDGTLTTVPGSKAPTVLALLGLRRDHGCRTEELIEWCWPLPVRPPTARRSLANIVARLRSLIGASGIETIQDGYRLSDDVGSHRQEFLDLARRAEKHLTAGLADSAAQLAEDGLGLWRGDPWGGIQEVDAINADRALLAGVRGRLLAVRAESAELSGNRLDAIALWEQLLTEEPYNDHGWRELAQCYLKDGRRTEGLRVLQRARTSLAQVGLLPGAELLSVERLLLGVDSATGAQHRSGASTEKTETGVGTDSRGVQLTVDRSIPFVGRSEESRAVLGLLDGATPARGLLIAGEPGAGKTRLLVECLRARPGLRVLACRAEPEPSGLLGPLGDILLDHRDLLPEDHLVALGSLVPGLDWLGRSPEGAFGGHATRPAEPGQVAAVACSAVEHIVRRVGGPAVVVIDDLHWASPIVFTVLMRLLGSVVPDGPAVIATHRSLPPDLQGDTADRVAKLAILPGTETIDLGPLDKSEVAALARSGNYVGDAGVLHDTTRGNALFVTESVRSNQPGSVSLPLRAVVRSRVQNVGDQALQYLELASLCGTMFRADLVARTAGLAPDVADELIDALYEAGILLPAAGGSETARFTHALVAEALTAPLGRRRRQHLHLSLAGTFREAGQPVTRWVGHLVAAGSLVDLSTLIAAVEMAVDAFTQEQDHSAIIDLCRQTLGIDMPEAQAAAIQIELGRAMMRVAMVDRGRLEVAGVAETARRLDDPQLMADAALTYATAGAWSSNADELGPALLREALAMLASAKALEDAAAPGSRSEQQAAVLKARLEARLGGWNIFTASLEERDKATTTVLDTVRDSGDDVALTDALNARHIAVSCPAALEQTLAVEAELEELEATGRGFAELANSPLPGTYWSADGHRYHLGIDHRLARPDRDLDPMTCFLSAVRANYRGDTADSRRLAGRSIDLKDDDVGRGNHLWLHVVADWIDGDVGRSRELADQRLDELGGAPLRCTALWTRAAAGDLVGAGRLRDRLSSRSLARLPELFLGGFGLGSATMAAEALDDEELGLTLAVVLEPYRHQMLGVPWASFPCAAFFLGIIQAKWGNPAAAADHFKLADEIHRRMRAKSFLTLADPWR